MSVRDIDVTDCVTVARLSALRGGGDHERVGHAADLQRRRSARSTATVRVTPPTDRQTRRSWTRSSNGHAGRHVDAIRAVGAASSQMPRDGRRRRPRRSRRRSRHRTHRDTMPVMVTGSVRPHERRCGQEQQKIVRVGIERTCARIQPPRARRRPVWRKACAEGSRRSRAQCSFLFSAESRPQNAWAGLLARKVQSAVAASRLWRTLLRITFPGTCRVVFEAGDLAYSGGTAPDSHRTSLLGPWWAPEATQLYHVVIESVLWR